MWKISNTSRGSSVQSNGECRREAKKRVQAGWNGWICDMRVPVRVKGKVVQGGSETSNVVRVGDDGDTDEKTGGGDGGGRVDVTIFIRSDKNGQYQE